MERRSNMEAVLETKEPLIWTDSVSNAFSFYFSILFLPYFLFILGAQHVRNAASQIENTEWIAWCDTS